MRSSPRSANLFNQSGCAIFSLFPLKMADNNEVKWKIATMIDDDQVVRFYHKTFENGGQQGSEVENRHDD